MQEVTIIFPHQLFKAHPALNTSRTVFLVEEALLFRQYNFHKQKLILHRASMKAYQDYLLIKKYSVRYIETTNAESDIRQLIRALAQDGVTQIHYAATADNWLERRLHQHGSLLQIQLIQYNSPNFLNTLEEVSGFFQEKKIYFQTDFYIAQRKQRNILLEGPDKPLGGKWSYDADNRLKFPAGETIPAIAFPPHNKYTEEAMAYVQRLFPNNPGCSEPLRYPIHFEDAEKWLDDFFANRFTKFGVYQDAMISNEHFLQHAVLTPMLNIGLLNPPEIIDKAIDAAIEYDIPLNSLEGFIRQIMGWREFIRIVYEREGSKQRTTNFWGFTRKLPAVFRTGDTGITPVDAVIKKLLQTGYSHHIERLMVLGNFMILCEFDPDEVYKWFMEMYVDSYDWVMVPNVYGMTQFADGGLMATKPYISGSNYLKKMGDFKKGPWQQVWDGLFWRFLHVHRSFFLKNPRLAMLVGTFDKMGAAKQQTHLNNAEKFLLSLDEQNKTKI